jgi:hypothetical protein
MQAHATKTRPVRHCLTCQNDLWQDRAGVRRSAPDKIGDTAQATLVLVQFEHKMITKAAEKNPQGTDRPKDGELAWRMLVSGLLGVWARC